MPNPVPGTIVPTGALVSPGGNQGAGGPMGPNGPTVVSADAGNIATLGSDNLILVPQSTLWNMRLRSFNAVGNPNFEVNQRMGGVSSIPAGQIWPADRWFVYNATGTSGIFCSASNGQIVKLPGTNFNITQGQVYFNTQSAFKPSLGATDQLILAQYVEGPVFRELQTDVHSLSILAQTNIPGGLKFALILQDQAAAYTLAKLCTIPAPNVPTLIQLPNLPIWSSSATWSNVAGQYAYNLIISLAAGASQIAPANDVWVNGNFRGAIGMDNLLAKPANSIVQFWFVQHEPGPQCTQLIDKPFSQNYDECLRYFCKSYLYGGAPGAVNNFGCPTAYILGGGHPYIPVFYKKTMAKSPTVTGYSNLNGAINCVYDNTGAANKVVTAVGNAGDAGFQGFTVTGPNAGNWLASFHYTADTGW